MLPGYQKEPDRVATAPRRVPAIGGGAVIVAIGSRALKPWMACKVGDLDLVADPGLKPAFDAAFRTASDSPDKTVYRGRRTVEVEWAKAGTSNEVLLQSGVGNPLELPGVGEFRLACPKALTAVYAAHLLFPIQWHKHAPKYWALRDLGFVPDEELYALRREETARRTKYRASRYDRPNEEFFRDSVEREVPHDELHLRLAFHGRPLFERVKRDLSRSGICLDMFEALPRETRLESIWEEALVLGHERYRANGTSDEVAARKALYGLCTNWYPLEFRPFVLDNYRELLDRFPYGMWDRLKGG